MEEKQSLIDELTSKRVIDLANMATNLRIKVAD